MSNPVRAQLKFLRDFYSPFHKKTFVAADPRNNSIEILIEDGLPVESFWYLQLRDEANEIKENKDYKPYFQLILPETTNSKPKTK